MKTWDTYVGARFIQRHVTSDVEKHARWEEHTLLLNEFCVTEHHKREETWQLASNEKGYGGLRGVLFGQPAYPR